MSPQTKILISYQSKQMVSSRKTDLEKYQNPRKLRYGLSLLQPTDTLVNTINVPEPAWVAKTT